MASGPSSSAAAAAAASPAPVAAPAKAAAPAKGSRLTEIFPAWKVLKPFAFGGLAGCTATVIVQPIDMVKVQIQLMEGKDGSRNPFSVASRIIEKGGVGSLYNGLSAGILRQLTYGTRDAIVDGEDVLVPSFWTARLAPLSCPQRPASRSLPPFGSPFSPLFSPSPCHPSHAGMSRLGIFRTMTNYYSDNGAKKLDMATNTMCSVVAGGLGALSGTYAHTHKPALPPSPLPSLSLASLASRCSLSFPACLPPIGTPADAALVRMQADTTLPAAERRNYRNGVDAMMRMAREEGMKGFFSGASPTIMRGLAMNVGMLASYDKLKEAYAPILGGPSSQATLVMSSFTSGVIAATVALPFDFLKTRLQKMKVNPDGTYPYKGFFDAAMKIAAKEGPLSFYTGYPTFLVRITPHIGLTWLVMEALNTVDYLK